MVNNYYYSYLYAYISIYIYIRTLRKICIFLWLFVDNYDFMTSARKNNIAAPKFMRGTTHFAYSTTVRNYGVLIKLVNSAYGSDEENKKNVIQNKNVSCL